MQSFSDFYIIIKNLRFQKTFYFFFLICLLSALLEAISIGTILPLLSLITDENFLKTYPLIYNFLLMISPINFFSFESSEKIKIIFSVCSFTFLIFLLRFFFQVFTEWVKAKFIYDLEYSIANKLFRNIMNAPYIFHLNSNSSNFHRDIQSNIGYFAATANAITIFLIETLIVLGLIFLALKINFKVTTLIIFLFSIFGFLFLGFTKKINLSLGKAVHEFTQIRIKNLIEGLGGIKEILIFNKVDDFINQFSQSNFKLASAKKKNSIIGSLPRYIIEILLVFILVITLLIVSKTINPIVNNLTLLGFFSATFIRITPSAYRIISSLQRIKFTQKILNSLSKNLEYFDKIRIEKDFKIDNQKNENIKIKNKIIIENIKFSYNSKKKLFDDLSLEIKIGETIGIFGESGSGKSSFVNLLTGLLKPEKGKILINNTDINSNISLWRKNIGYVPQNIFLIDDTLKKNISLDFENELQNSTRFNECLKQSELVKFIGDLPLGINTLVGERGSRISGGQLQRVGIARALYRNPEILIFDESTSALDRETELEILKNIYKFKDKKTMIIITHKKELLKNCDKIYKLENGKFFENEK
jgi:ATP-binding cassette, subfamily B, bacterial PglK